MVRNFICPESDALCEDPGCKRDVCVAAETLAIKQEAARVERARRIMSAAINEAIRTKDYDRLFTLLDI